MSEENTRSSRRGQRSAFTDMVRKIVAQEETTLIEPKRKLYKAALALLTAAANGEDWAIKELGNRLDGRPFQAVGIADANGNAINLFDPGALRGMPPDKVAQLRTLLAEAAQFMEQK